jgi:hypothetical protein
LSVFLLFFASCIFFCVSVSCSITSCFSISPQKIILKNSFCCLSLSVGNSSLHSCKIFLYPESWSILINKKSSKERSKQSKVCPWYKKRCFCLIKLVIFVFFIGYTG